MMSIKTEELKTLRDCVNNIQDYDEIKSVGVKWAKWFNYPTDFISS